MLSVGSRRIGVVCRWATGAESRYALIGVLPLWKTGCTWGRMLLLHNGNLRGCEDRWVRSERLQSFSRSIWDSSPELLCSRQAAPRQQQPMLYTGPGSLHPAGAVVSCPAGGSWPLRLEIMHRQGRVRDEERLATFFSSSLSQGVS